MQRETGRKGILTFVLNFWVVAPNLKGYYSRLMATKPSAHFKRVLSVLRQVAAKIPDSQEAAKVSTDLDSLLKRRKQTVDKHEISVLVRQAEAKLVMARIRYKSIV